MFSYCGLIDLFFYVFVLLVFINSCTFLTIRFFLIDQFVFWITIRPKPETFKRMGWAEFVNNDIMLTLPVAFVEKEIC